MPSNERPGDLAPGTPLDVLHHSLLYQQLAEEETLSPRRMQTSEAMNNRPQPEKMNPADEGSGR